MPGAMIGTVDTRMTYNKVDMPFPLGFLPTCPKGRQANGPTQWSVTGSGALCTEAAGIAGLLQASCPPSQMFSSLDLILATFFSFLRTRDVFACFGVNHPLWA